MYGAFLSLGTVRVGHPSLVAVPDDVQTYEDRAPTQPRAIQLQ